MCAYYVADVATPVFFRIGCLFLSSAHHISPRGLTANSGCRQWRVFCIENHRGQVHWFTLSGR